MPDQPLNYEKPGVVLPTVVIVYSWLTIITAPLSVLGVLFLLINAAVFHFSLIKRGHPMLLVLTVFGLFSPLFFYIAIKQWKGFIRQYIHKAREAVQAQFGLAIVIMLLIIWNISKAMMFNRMIATDVIIMYLIGLFIDIVIFVGVLNCNQCLDLLDKS